MYNILNVTIGFPIGFAISVTIGGQAMKMYLVDHLNEVQERLNNVKERLNNIHEQLNELDEQNNELDEQNNEQYYELNPFKDL